MPGPIPDPQRRRRNTPTIPTTALPATGRPGSVPRSPKWVELGGAGTAWWRWAWKTPQAAGWALGHEALVARRAMLEDDLAALSAVEGLDYRDAKATETEAELKALVGRLASLAAGGRLAIYREMRELDDRLGLSPKGMAALRWEIVAVEPAEAGPVSDEMSKRRERRSRLVG